MKNEEPVRGQRYDRHVVYVNYETFTPELSVTRVEVITTTDQGVFLIPMDKVALLAHLGGEAIIAKGRYIFVAWSDWPAHTRSQGKTWITYQPVTQ